MQIAKEIYEQKGSLSMLAFKVLYDQIQKFIEERNGIKTTNLGLDTAKLLRCILKYQNRLKTILIFVKVANLVKKITIIVFSSGIIQL
jgi:hypothetical protein